MSLKYFSIALAATASALPQFDAQMKGTTDNPCEPCNPKGASGTNPPAIGADLSTLYTDVLESVKGIGFQKRENKFVFRDTGFCCPKSLNCINVQGVNIAACYDKFTTNFGFADGSYGSLTSGDYTSGSNKANLLTGDFTANGQSGNIYANKQADKPNTSTFSKPPQFTGTGVGGAIPANQLGSVITITTTIPAQTYTAPTTVPQSVQVNTFNGVVVSTTISAKTISEATTIAPVTSVQTITQQAASSAPASSKGGASHNVIDGTRGLGMSVLGALMYALL